MSICIPGCGCSQFSMQLGNRSSQGFVVVIHTKPKLESDHDIGPPASRAWFEVDVFLKISERGYRVIPQFEVAGYRIDLVVEGMRGRLAVECDGDTWHGVDRYAEDAARQRALERCGWTFWRVRGSSFNRDPDGALLELWGTLNRIGIHPASQDSDTTGVVDVVVVDDKARENQTWGSYGATASRETSEGKFFLSQYRTWTRRPLPNPRTASRFDVAQGLADIIAVEGPMICHRAYRIYLNAAGIAGEAKEVGFELFQILHGAIRLAMRLEDVEERDELGTHDQVNQIVRKRSTPPVVLRTRGDRTFQEIPPAEIGEMMKCLLTQDSKLRGEVLLQAVLEQYKIESMTPDIRASLLKIKAQYVDSHLGLL